MKKSMTTVPIVSDWPHCLYEHRKMPYDVRDPWKIQENLNQEDEIRHHIP